MERREFLGWDGPFLGKVVEWLWARREAMPRLAVVVPTAQSGRRLREALAERGPCLAPRVVTPGWCLAGEESRELAVLAWVEALEAVEDWSAYAAVFPEPPGVGEAPGWSLPLARSLVGVERALGEGGLEIAGAARWLAETPEGERWRALAELAAAKERLVARLGGAAGYGRVAERLDGVDVERWVLAGVAELPGALTHALESREVAVLMAAPEVEAEGFDEWGRPRPECWNDRPLPWPGDERVALCADPEEQAREALRRVAAAGTASDRLALGSGDEETAEALVAALGRAGWPAFNPAGGGVAPLAAWWSAWRAFLERPEAATAIDLLGCREADGLVGRQRAQRVAAISRMRDRGLIRDLEDAARAVELEREKGWERDERLALLAHETLDKLLKWRAGFRRRPFVRAMEELLERVDRDGAMDEVADWLKAMAGAIERSGREDAGFWLELMIGGLATRRRELPERRVVDVQGWLELLHEPGEHLVVCGLNEGKVPPAGSGDPWLPEATRRALGLIDEQRRAARDAYLLRAMIEARRESGRVDLLLAKSSAAGDALLPSRLLLAAGREELPGRVGQLFEELEPPDAGLAWQADWKWSLPEFESRERLGVTSFRDYLACPLRFFLKHVLDSGEPEPERVEWNARDFGTLAHEVLEAWGRDEEAREWSKTEVLAEWLEAELERRLARRFGGEPPLAVRIQARALRQRLGWFARWQACQRADGWRVEAVEESFEFELGGMAVRGQVDRIDGHPERGRRVLDYKTYASWRKVEDDHLVGSRAALPAHLEEVEAVWLEQGKKRRRWKNLQVPLYAQALEGVAELGYLVLAATEADTRESLWPDFGEAERESARACAEWVVGQVAAGVFEPAAERVAYDDYAVLGMGRPLAECIAMKGVES